MRPRNLEALFTPGSRLASGDRRVALITEPAYTGRLRLPTGSVIAADPFFLIGADPFTVTVTPGDHAVLIASMRWEGTDEEGETPAAMVRILDRPAVSWELALLPGQDGRLLDDGEFYGFGVDTGMGCFLDASGRDELEKVITEWGEGHGHDVDLLPAEVHAPETGTNLIAVRSGMGDSSYPVWAGRDAGGNVTAFVADLLVLHDADALPPTAPSTAVCLPSFIPVADDRRKAPCTSPAATAAFMAAHIGQAMEDWDKRPGLWR